MRLNQIVLALFVLMGFTQLGFALPLHQLQENRVMSQAPSMTADYNFEGIVGLSDCSGSLVRFDHSKDTDRALVMTNGHCVESGFPAYGTYLYGQQSSRTFDVLNPDASIAGKVTAEMIIYSTMTKTDMTIYRLTETYEDIQRQFNVRPLTLTTEHPKQGAPIEIISGYWKLGYRCGIEAFIGHLREGDWTWEDSMRYTRPGCEVIGGTSGSPILQAGTRTMIGLNNTGNENGESCTDNNPCEVDDHGGVSQTKGFSYGQQAFWVYSCLNSSNEIDLGTPGCQLFHKNKR